MKFIKSGERRISQVQMSRSDQTNGRPNVLLDSYEKTFVLEIFCGTLKIQNFSNFTK